MFGLTGKNQKVMSSPWTQKHSLTRHNNETFSTKPSN